MGCEPLVVGEHQVQAQVSHYYSKHLGFCQAVASKKTVLAENSHPPKDRPAGQHNPFGEPPEREPGTGFADVRIPVPAQTQQEGLSDAI
jgi:hypothetical protein